MVFLFHKGTINHQQSYSGWFTIWNDEILTTWRFLCADPSKGWVTSKQGIKRSWLKSPGRWWFQTLTCGVDPLLVEWIHLDWNHQLVKLSIGPCFGWCSSVIDGDFFSLLRSHGLFLGGGFKYKNPIWGRFPFFQEISNRIHWTDPSTWVSNSFSNLLRGPLVRSHSIFDGILTDIFRLGWNHHLGPRSYKSFGKYR